MHISNIYSVISHLFRTSSNASNQEQPRTLLARELSCLTYVEALPRHILIKGDIHIDSSNIHAFVLLQSKEVKIEGSLTCDLLFVSKFLEQQMQDFSKEAPDFLPQKLHVQGDVNFSTLNTLTSLPKIFEVEGDLDLAHCTALASLPEGLKIKGSLNLSYCTRLTHLPSDLEIGRHLDLSHCEALISLPKGLKVKGPLDLSYCINLTYLPSDLEIGKHLNLSYCTALTSLPERFKVKGTLDLSCCTNIIRLSEDLTVERDLKLSHCTGLTALPSGLKVKRSLELSGCTRLAYLPKGLELEGDLDLAHCTALTSLPEGLNIKGSLNLSGYKQLTYLPQDLIVERDLKLLHCNALIALPEGLKVKGTLDLSYCTTLTYLPEDLTVERDLDLSNCTALTSLPKGLKVKGTLDLSYCTTLTHLPEDLEVGKNLKLSKCLSLAALPEGLKVGGSLNLSSCYELIHLPEDLTVEGDLDLSYCKALRVLPPSLKLGGNLNLHECRHLTSLPNWITTLGYCFNGARRTLNLTGCGLSPTIISRLQEDTRDLEGIQIHFSFRSAKEYMIPFKDLLLALEFWQKEALQDVSLNLEEICKQLHQRLTQVQDHQNLLEFLMRLTGTVDYSNLSTRKTVGRQVFEMIQLMIEDHEVCQQIAFLIHQGLASCEDRIAATLSDISFYQKRRALQHPSVMAEEIKNVGRGFFLLEELNKKIASYTKTLRFVDEVEVAMAFHIRLQKMLNLPLETKNMLFRKCVDISDEEIDQIGTQVLQEVTDAKWETFLALWDPWREYQRRTSIIEWKMLPSVEKNISSIICPYLQDTPEHPVLYNNVVYDYEAFIQRYIAKGVDLYGMVIQMDQLFRVILP